MSVHGYSDNGFVNDFVDDPISLISRLDMSDPLHLHHNESTALNDVSIKLKGTKNYQVWSCAMLLDLEGKNKTGFIDGSCKRSNTDESKMISDGKIVDSSANQHLTNTDKELNNVYDISHIKIKVDHPNGTKDLISKIGNLGLPNGLVLFDVLVVPKYGVTLISVHKLAKDNKIFVAFDESRYSVTKKIDTLNVFQDLNYINFFDNEYPEMPNDDERVDPNLNSDYKSQSNSSHASMPGGGVDTADFPSNNSGHDADNIF
ncbi:ribonuclease H-like domain-containing protein [Tanacetum coccineum]|uniref:Ribonuclease H-like domain-containing protein n=1 Tax=Tanacetum coccineum TaxID=301880 RepID=A0ABQ4ZET7_9ASTR